MDVAALTLLGVALAALVSTTVYLITRIERRLERIDARLTAIEGRFDARLTAIEGRLAALEHAA